MKTVKVNQHLKQYCRDRNISIVELANKAGLQMSGLYQEKNFTLETVAKLLTALDCKFEDIFEIVVEDDSQDIK